MRKSCCLAGLLCVAASLIPEQSSAAPPKPDPGAKALAQAEELEQLSQQLENKMREQKLDEALAVALRALSLRKKISAKQEIIGLEAAIEVYKNRGEYAQAGALYERIVLLYEKEDKEEFSLRNALMDWGSALLQAGDYGRSATALQRALVLAEKRNDPSEIVPTLQSLANSLAQLGQYERAEATYMRALSICEQLERERDWTWRFLVNIPWLLLDIGEFYDRMGKWPRAEQFLARALKMQERAGHQLDMYLYPLANMRLSLQDYAGALPLYERALSYARRYEGDNDSLDVAKALYHLGNFHVETGAYDLAEPLLTRSQSIAAKAALPDELLLHRVRLALGKLAGDKGDFERAEQLLSTGIAALTRLCGQDSPEVAGALLTLAELLCQTHAFARAESAVRRALKIFDAQFPLTHPRRAQAQELLGRLRELRGDAAGSKKLLEQTLYLREQAFGKEHPQVAMSLMALADFARRADQLKEAEALYKRAVAIVQKNFGPDNYRMADILLGLAAVYLKSGNTESAIRCAELAADLRERYVALVVSSGAEAQKRSFLQALRVDSDFLISLQAHHAAEHAAARQLALTTLLQRKGRVLDVMTDALARFRQHASDQDKQLLDELLHLRRELSNAAVLGPADVPLDTFRAGLQALEQKVRAVEQKIGDRLDALREQGMPITIERVMATIPQDAVLIEMVAYVPRSSADRDLPKSAGPSRYAAYVLFASGEIEYVDLGETQPIDAAVRRLRGALSLSIDATMRRVRLASSQPDGNSDPKKCGRDLDELVMKPLRPLLKGKTHLLVSPDGALSLFPFGALVDEDGRYLLERFDITYLTSGRDLVRLAKSQESRSNALIIANPAFGRQPRQRSVIEMLQERPAAASASARALGRNRDIESVIFDPLPGTHAEALDVSAVLPGATLRVDTDATESMLKQAKAPRILHIATHGFFLPTRRAGPVAASDHGSDLEADFSWLPDEPLLHSGLALAGANARDGGSGEDGILTALEAASLNLSGTKLVVLSACETGLGEVFEGEGVYGLRRALFVAGAETLVASLWKVADEETRSLMTDYYKRLMHGGERGAALREAQLAMLRRPATAHPYYWASFAVYGAASALSARP